MFSSFWIFLIIVQLKEDLLDSTMKTILFPFPKERMKKK